MLLTWTMGDTLTHTHRPHSNIDQILDQFLFFVGLFLHQSLSLLLVSLLSFWSLPTTAQLTIASTSAAEGDDVLLLVLNVPANLGRWDWYRGKRTDNKQKIGAYVIETQAMLPGPENSGRERIHLNGSLMFQKVTLKDTGYYTVQITMKDLNRDTATGQLRVYGE